MAILINGNGNPAIYPDQDADWFASIFGGQSAITGVGSQFAAEIQDANTIALADGVIITKEGRRIQLDANQSDIFEIPTGAQGTTNYYIIGYCLTTNDDSSQTAETFVQLMENATDTIDEDTFRGGADKVYVSVYRVTQTGFNLETPELLLPKVESITQLNSDLTDGIGGTSDTFRFGTDNGQYGYIKKVGGADTFFPFSSGELTLKAKGVVVSSDAPINITIDKNCRGKLVLVLTNDYNYQTYSLSGDALVNQSTEYTLGWALRTGSTNSNMLVIDLELQSGTLTIQFSRPQSNSASFYALITN